MLQLHGVPLVLAPKLHPSNPELHLRFRVLPGLQFHSPPIEVLSNALSIIYCILYTRFKRCHSWTPLHSETIGVHLVCAVLTSILAYNIGAQNTGIAFALICFP